MRSVLTSAGCTIIILVFFCAPAFAQCRGNLDFDRDIDGIDLAEFIRDFNQIDCAVGAPCKADIYPVGAPDGAVDEFDLAEFAVYFGREDCPLPLPANLFNIGDSIGEGEAANGERYEPNHDVVWSTGYNPADSVSSFNERFEGADPAGYDENNSPATDATFNLALSGAEMFAFKDQAEAVADAARFTPAGKAGMLTILLGPNDVCADTLDDMTSPEEFEANYRAGLTALYESEYTSLARIHVSGIPAIYWLWNAKRTDFLCRFIWLFVPCQNLLADPANDCAGGGSHLDPDNINPGDGPNCVRRKQFHALIRDVYNPILRDVLLEYKFDGKLPNASYVDILDVEFFDNHVNDGDCFHPSIEGHQLLSEEQWLRTPWGMEQ